MAKTSRRKIDPALFMDDPDWFLAIPEAEVDNRKCRLPAHEDCTPLDVEAVSRHLEKGGLLGAMEDYEERPGQLDMLRAVVRACNDRCHLMVEAGTGVGKSLAYLVPAVQWSFLNDTPVVVSTATRNLQSQLVLHDLPRAARTLGADAPKFRAAVLKGRTNYLCLRALAEYMQGGYWTLTDDEREDFARLVEWLQRTEDGDLDTLGCEDLRRHLACPGEDCYGRTCRYRSRCFIAKARDRALKAHVVVVNHALTLTEAANPGSGLLGAYGRLIFDEAHNLEDVATELFSFELSRPALLKLTGRLARVSQTRRGPARTRGLLGAVDRLLQRGTVADGNAVEAVRRLLGRAQVQLRLVYHDGDALFDVLSRLLSPAPKTQLLRYRRPPTGETMPNGEPVLGPRQYALKGIFADYDADQWDETALIAAATAFESSLAKLQETLVALAETLQELVDELPSFGDLAVQSRALAESFTGFILESKFVLSASDPSRVYWVERCEDRHHGKSMKYVRLVAAPLSVAAEMNRCFYDVKDTVVLCSATLRAGDRFDYMARKLGVTLAPPERVRKLVAASPFDYLRQALVLAPKSLPDPAANQSEYVKALAPFLRDLFVATSGRALTLFTSYEMMRAVAEEIRPMLDSAALRLLVQGYGLSREAMTAELRASTEPNAPGVGTVLFGAQSFWEGVDVPGAALSCVVLARLPFPQLGEPITEARGEKVQEEGGSSFRDYLLPEALIRFRQGFGRLVRTRRDRGVVVVTDCRVVAKNYGTLFRRAIPATTHSCEDIDSAIARIREFMRDS